MFDKVNEFLQDNDIMVRCFTEWFRLESVHIDDNGTMPIIVSDDDGGQREFDMADIEEFEPVFQNLDSTNIGVA